MNRDSSALKGAEIIQVMALLAIAGCIDIPTAFQCANSSICDLEPGGRCVAATDSRMWCQYPSGSCATGYKWSVQAAEVLANQCVEGTSAEDAGSPDAVLPDAPVSDTADATISEPDGAVAAPADAGEPDAPASVNARFEVEKAVYDRFESGGTVTIQIVRSVDTAGTAHVDYATSDGTAKADADYDHATGTLDFAPGEVAKPIVITLHDNVAFEGKQTFNLTLLSPVGGTLGSKNSTIVNILDDDVVNGDFSATLDGQCDLVIRDERTGALKLWLMDGNTLQEEKDLPLRGSGYELAGIADFNADGRPDLLWRHPTTFDLDLWYLRGTINTGSGALAHENESAEWEIAAVGDLSGDGFADLVWLNTTTQGYEVWRMRDNVKVGTTTFTHEEAASWKLVGLADLNRDRKQDLVWRNQQTKKTEFWLMDGLTFVSSEVLSDPGGTWSLVGLGDLNHDGNSDLIWHSAGSTVNLAWVMDRTEFTTSLLTLPKAATADWIIVAPR